MSLYETLKAAKIGAASNVFTTLRAQQAPFAKNSATIKELEGVPPLNFTSNGDSLMAYSLSGAMAYSGTPTSANPIFPSECGDLVESGAHSGEYVLPIVCGGSTTNYYLSEPIRKIGSYKDVASYTGVERAIFCKILTGEENFSVRTGKEHTFGFSITASANVNCVCSHYVNISSSQFDVSNGIFAKNTAFAYISDLDYSSTTAFKAFLAEQYENGTPVTIWGVRSTAITESVSAPEISTVKGSNTFDVDTTLTPSSVYIKYKE